MNAGWGIVIGAAIIGAVLWFRPLGYASFSPYARTWVVVSELTGEGRVCTFGQRVEGKALNPICEGF